MDKPQKDGNIGKIVMGNYDSQTPDKIHPRSYYITKKINEIHDQWEAYHTESVLKARIEELKEVSKREDSPTRLHEYRWKRIAQLQAQLDKKGVLNHD